MPDAPPPIPIADCSAGGEGAVAHEGSAEGEAVPVRAVRGEGRVRPAIAVAQVPVLRPRDEGRRRRRGGPGARLRRVRRASWSRATRAASPAARRRRAAPAAARWCCSKTRSSPTSARSAARISRTSPRRSKGCSRPNRSSRSSSIFASARESFTQVASRSLVRADETQEARQCSGNSPASTSRTGPTTR